MLRQIRARFQSNTLKDRAISGVVITISGFGIQKAIQLASNLVLARLLFPEAFGLMALVNVFIVGVQMLSDTGIYPALVQAKRIDDTKLLNTAWTIQFFRGFLLWAAIVVLAYPASILYKEPLLFELLVATGSVAAIKGMHSIGAATALRNIQAGRTLLVRLVGQIATTIVMIGLAIKFKSVWALCIGTVVGAACEMLLTYIVLPKHRHQFEFDRKKALGLFHFGKWIFIGTLLTYLGGQGIRAIEGTMVPTATLGLIAIAATISWAAVEAINHILGRVIFPALSEIKRDNTGDFQNILARLKLKILILTLPFFTALSLLSSWIIDLLYDERYQFAGPILAILALNGAINSIPTLYQTTVLSLGHTKTHFKLNVCATTCKLIGLMLGYQFGGVLGMLAGTGLGGVVYYGIAVFLLRDLKFIQYKADILSLLILSVFAVGTYYINIVPWV